MDFRLVSIPLLGFLCLIRSSETAVTNWTSPANISSATGTASATIAENSIAGTTLFKATATVTTTATYALTNNATGKGTIDTTTGVVTLVKGQYLDYERASTLTFVVEATDSGGGAAGTVTVTLSLTDVNEIAPVFSATTITSCIADNSAAGTTLGTYTATDTDYGHTVTYAISAGNSNTDFAMASSTGIITVATGQTIAKATTASYALVVFGTDNNGTPLTGTATISVTVGDCSDVGAFAATMALVFGAFVATQFL